MQTIMVSAKNNESSSNFINQFVRKNNINLNIMSPDFSYLQIPEGKKVIQMDEVRNFIKWCNILPSYSKHKVAQIDADGLSIESQNALLKTIEEPPNYLLIILITENSKHLLDTVISRCRLYEVNSAKYSLMPESEIEITSIMNMDLGQRIDWAFENKSEAQNKLEEWIPALRSMVDRSENSQVIEKYIRTISILSELLNKIKNNNLNPVLALEYFLVNI